MEGLKVAPWFREHARRKLIAIDDCGKCMQNVPQLQRQSLGCGYEPRTEIVPIRPWTPPDKFFRGELTTCAGYTANLPEVAEAALARAHWKHGSLRDACDGEQPTEDLMNSVLIFDAACGEVEGWMMTPSKDGGGGS